MDLISVQEYATRYKVSQQSVYARIKSGSIQAVIKDGVKMIQDDRQDKANNIQPIDKTDSIHIKALKKEIKRLKKDLKKSEEKRERSDNRLDQLLNLMLSKKEIPFFKDEIIDVAIKKKKKRKK